MTGLPLRDYQKEALVAIERAWQSHSAVATVLPTGAGKTVVFSHLAARARAQGQRTLVLVHTNELVEQAVDKLRQHAPHLSRGVIKAERNENAADVMVATVQTVRARGRLDALRATPGGDNLLIVVDECHHVTAASYRTVLDALKPPADRQRVAGFTATLSRGDGAALGDVWETVAYRRDIIDMIKEGYLLPPRGKRIKVPDLDLRKAKMSGGDYADEAMADALSEALAPELTAKAYVEHASDRSGILFAPTVDSAYEFAAAFSAAGIVTETVHGGLPKAERAAILHRLHIGETQLVSNCMVLTEGFDEPRASCVVVARPTTSSGLYVQMVGRVLRPYPGQIDALVLDVVGVTGRHRLAGAVDLIGDKTKILRVDDEENLADWLLDENGLAFEEEEGPAGGSFPLEYARADEIEVHEVDLFAKSHSAWLRTVDGVWFLAAGRAFVFLVPNGDRFNVAVTDGLGGEMRYTRVDLDVAMAWGEEVAKELGGGPLVNKKGAWRRKSEKATEAQIKYGHGLGIINCDTMSKGELSDRINEVKASRTLGRIVRGWA